MNFFLYFLMLVFVSLIIRSILQFANQRAFIMNERIDTFIGSPIVHKKGEKKRNAEPGLLYKEVSVFSGKMKERLSSKISKETKSDLERRLREAGLSYKWTPVGFRFIQILIGAVLFISSLLLFGKLSDKFFALLLLAGAMGALGYQYPSFYLSSLKKKRVAKVEKTLADFFDMVNLSVEAGMGLDAAIARACKNSPGPLSEEFNRALEEMRLGKSRRDAFIGLRSSITLDAFQSVMTSLIQADQLGIGMSKVLRALTERIREHQRQIAREKAMKAPIKMLFPMIFFVFPAIFVILLGPLIIYLLKYGLGGQ
ncbi:type II secretion system F family protein [Neobacillus sp. SAB-20_R2A]|uniref:type II secretion system F family protein n=1 Tax=Neobacillus sp. SAB-20_R2A TaxID=3120519 RepID=UPI003C6DBC4B